MRGGEKKIVRRGRARAWRRPQRRQYIPEAGLLGGEPERARQPQVQGGGRQGNGRGAVFDEGGHLLGTAKVGLVDDAGLAVDAGAFDDVLVELVGLLLGDEGSHTG